MEYKYKNKVDKRSPLNYISKFECFAKEQQRTFSYSVYENGESGYGDTKLRETKKVSEIEAFFDSLLLRMNDLPVNKELAIHSKVVGEKRSHIPFIDFICSPDNPDLILSLLELQKTYNYDIYLFKSGRSVHGYLDTMLTERGWEKFLGSLLLLNHETPITDSRWIGHSLKQGFSSLRLSCNTNRYLSSPQFWQKLPRSI